MEDANRDDDAQGDNPGNGARTSSGADRNDVSECENAGNGAWTEDADGFDDAQDENYDADDEIDLDDAPETNMTPKRKCKCGDLLCIYDIY